MILRALLVAQMVKNLPAMWEIWVWSLGQEDPLEKGIATHISILTWRIPWTDELCGLQSKGWQRVGHDWATNIFFLSTLVKFCKASGYQKLILGAFLLSLSFFPQFLLFGCFHPAILGASTFSKLTLNLLTLLFCSFISSHQDNPIPML